MRKRDSRESTRRKSLDSLSQHLHCVLREVLEHPELEKRLVSNEPHLFASEAMNGHAIVVFVRPSRPLSVLTPRELSVAEMVGKGLGDQGIANELKLSVHTVKAHLRSVYRKLGVRSRANLARRLSDETL